MIGRKDGLIVERSGRCGFRETTLAWLLGAILCAGPVVAQTEPPAPQAQPAAPLPVGAASVSPPTAPASTGLAGAAPAGQSPAPPEEASNPPTRFTDALLPSSLPRDLSPWGMFLSASVSVSIGMLALAFASLAP